LSAPIARAGDPPNLKFAADRPADMRHIKVDCTIDLARKTFDATARLEMVALRDLSTIQLDAEGFDIKSVEFVEDRQESTPAKFEYDGHKITLHPTQPLREGQRFVAEIKYRVQDPEEGLHFFAPSKDEPDVPFLAWTQGESITTRDWIPCFDHPNDRQTTEINCTVAKPYIAISNGKLVETRDNPDGSRSFHWLQESPHVAYLMTLVVGDFHVETDTWRGKPISYYVRPIHKDKVKNSFANTPAMLDFFSDKIGVEYPWDKYAQVCCYGFGGGMENTSATTLTEQTLHDDRAHMDRDSDSLVAHELAHQWWGDLVTCREWAHLWLNEGFATYFEDLWQEHHLGKDEFCYQMHQEMRSAIDGGRDKPIVWREYEDPDEQFDSRAYPKGAWVLHMIRRRLGDEVFWKVINKYAQTFAHQTVETSDLRKTIENVTGRSFERFFHDWTERPGSPVVSAKYEWRQDEQAVSIRVRQTQEQAAYFFPLTIELRTAASETPIVITREIDSKDRELVVPMTAQPTMLRIDPDQAVLMELKEDKPRNLWAAQLESDPSVAARIRAAEHFEDDPNETDIKLLGARLRDEPYWGVQKGIAAVLGRIGDADARDQLIAGLNIKNPKARAAVVEALGNFEDDDAVANALKPMLDKGDESYQVEANLITSLADVTPDGADKWLMPLMSRDSNNEVIRSAVLKSLGKHGGPEALVTLMEWTKPAKPMQCRAAAMEGIGEVISRHDIEGEARTKAVRVLIEALRKPSRRIQTAALRVLGDMGEEARTALPAVERITHLGLPRVRSAAIEAAKKIRGDRSGKKAGRSGDGEVKSLRREVRKLRERIDRLAPAASQPAS
jgi:aminopeptidase N